MLAGMGRLRSDADWERAGAAFERGRQRANRRSPVLLSCQVVLAAWFLAAVALVVAYLLR